ncbi:MAG: hypothetical protein QM750_19570 [Rubrivivax sp.]
MSGPGNDLPRDEHLRAALRHAPDRDATAPAALSDRILAQARAATATTPRPGFVERWLAWWSRPVAAGAFASLLIAGFVGLMWREGPPPEALPGTESAPPAAMPAPPPAAAPAPSPAPAPMAEQAPAVAAPQPPIASPAPRPPPLPQRLPERRRERETPAAQPAAPAPTPAPEAMPAPAVPAPAAAPPPPAPHKAEQAATGRAAEQAAGAAEGADAAAAKAQPAPAAAPRAAAPSLGRIAGPAADPLSAALALLAGTAEDQSLRGRLAALRARVQSPWTPAAPPLAAPESLQAADGRPLGRLWVEPGRIVWQDAQGRTWQARLAP